MAIGGFSEVDQVARIFRRVARGAMSQKRVARRRW
jgi:hypothetical protein